MPSSNGNISQITGTLCGEFIGPGDFPAQRPVTRSFDVFFDLRLSKRLNKQPWGWWFETHRVHYDVFVMLGVFINISHELDGVSNHLFVTCLVNSFFGITTKKCSKLCILGFCEGNPLEIGTFPWLRARYTEDMPMSWCHFAADALNDVSKHFHNINTINRTTPIQLTIPHFLSAKNKKWKWSFWCMKIYHCVTFCSNFYVRSHIKHKEHWLGKCRIWTNS